MRHITKAACTLMLVLLLAACGKQHQAEVLAEEFMEANLSNPGAMSRLEFKDLDSTRVVSDSLVGVMRQRLEQGGRYKSGITYAEGAPTKPLMITRATYLLNGEECQDTYYLDVELTRVVAVKQN